LACSPVTSLVGRKYGPEDAQPALFTNSFTAVQTFFVLDAQHSSPDCYTQVLILRLRHYAQEQARLRVAPTDEMFQREARRLLFDSDDPWNQTIADRPEWLAVF
jgi:hypothetical protein